MKSKRSRIALLLMSVLLLCTMGVLSACNATKSDSLPEKSEGTAGSESDEKIEIVTTNFPYYDWVRTLLGDDAKNYELTLLLDTGVDMHSYQPTVEDIATISTCDMFVYTGGESDEWVAEVLADARNEDMIVVNLLEVLGDAAKTEEIKEGMEHDEHEHASEGSSEEEGEPDEHLWLSLRNAETLSAYLNSQLIALNPEKSAEYQANYEAYAEELAVLDEQFEETVETAALDTLVFADRFPFRYFTDDYDLNYFAAFPGCSAETEASFETVTFLAQKVDELDVDTILIIDGSDDSLAQTVIQSTQDKDQTIQVFDSLQSKTSADVEMGVTYLSTMQENLSTLKEVLN